MFLPVAVLLYVYCLTDSGNRLLPIITFTWGYSLSYLYIATFDNEVGQEGPLPLVFDSLRYLKSSIINQ